MRITRDNFDAEKVLKVFAGPDDNFYISAEVKRLLEEACHYICRANKKELNIQKKDLIMLKIDEDGNRKWVNSEGNLHRLDGPAYEYNNGYKSWWVNGKLHRIDGPAIEDNNGDRHWYINGKRHRDNGPATEKSDGDKYWYKNDKRHRSDGPACEYSNGTKEWWIDGKRHTEEEYKEVKNGN